MDAKNRGELAAGGNAITRTKVAGVNERAKLITQLDIEGNMTFGLEMYGQHCLSQRANDTMYWTDARANLSFHFWGEFQQREGGKMAGFRAGQRRLEKHLSREPKQARLRGL